MTRKRKAAAPAVPPPAQEEEEEESEEEEEVEVEVEVEVEEEVEEEEVEEEEEEEEEEDEGEQEEEEEDEGDDDDDDEDSQEEDEDSRREALTSLLLPYTKDQLVNILKEAADKNSDLVAGLIRSAESDPIHRKLFVHGLTSDATKEILTAAFRSYGQIEECNVVVDRATNRCKGFGFVLFKTRAAARKALREPQKRIGTRTASCQLAAAGPPGSGSTAASASGPDLSSRRLYVGNVGPDVSPDKLRAFFAKFGEIEVGPKGLSGSGKFRGFAIFVYKTEDGLRRALQDPIKDFDGRRLECSVYVESRGGSKSGSSSATPAAVSGGLQSHPLVGQNFNHGPFLLGQNPNLSLLNHHHPLMAHSLNPTPATTSSYAAAAVTARNQPSLIGLSGQQGMDSVINAYSSQAALDRLSSYQSSQIGHRTAPTSGGGGQSGLGSSINFPTYFRR